MGAAAYRSGEKLTAMYDGIVHDYTRKRGIVYKEILLPKHAPKGYMNREVLWNSVEEIEKSKNSQLSREVEIAIPKELSPDVRIALVKEYCQKTFVDVGMCADICIHEPNKKKGEENPHAHIMLTMRPIDSDGGWGAKSRKEYILDRNEERIYDKKKRQYKCRKINTVDWNDREKAEHWRSAWADIANQYLKGSEVVDRIDHRSFERQGIDKIPTIHMGVDVTQMERRGIVTGIGTINRKVKKENQLLQAIKKRLQELRASVKAFSAEYYSKCNIREEAASSIEFLIEGILESKGITIKSKSHVGNLNQNLYDLKAYAEAFSFIQENGVSSYGRLQEIYTKVSDKKRVNHERIKLVEKRTAELKELLQYAHNYKKFKPIYKKAKEVWNKEKYEARYQRELILFDAAKRYLDAHLEKGTKLKFKTWKRELDVLQSEKMVLNLEYKNIKREFAKVNNVKRQVDTLLREQGDNPVGQKQKKIDINKGMVL